ncbi:MAG: helix-turn-helix domain-containing protein, partial [Armatimonadetes bacterium]|nr:helix-turn-helix domain-containing protein [Armatimonadota bacterium]
EAGRAGRDGKPARAVLIYATQDRALQEWFIECDLTTADDLRALYRALGSQPREGLRITSEDLSLATGFHQVKVKLGLAQLEIGGAIERLGDEGAVMLVRVNRWDEAVMRKVVADKESRSRFRLEQLDHMVAYAESNSCRRRILLSHFGDESKPDAAECCDNCRPAESVTRGVAPDSSSEVALVILDTLRTLRWEVGQGKLAALLKGSHLQELRQFGYDRHPSYGKLADVSVDGIKDLIRQLIAGGYVKAVGGNLPVLRLAPKGEAAVEAGSAIRLTLPSGPPVRKQSKPVSGDTVEVTARLLAQGLSPARIAAQRGFTEETIYTHLARLIGEGRASVSDVVPTEVASRIRAAISLVNDISALSPIKAIVPDTILYGQIRCVAEAWKLEKGIRFSQPKEPGEKPESKGPVGDDVAAFLRRSHPQPLKGPWHSGWALDLHSRFAGDDWNRSSMGELAYRLKYQGDSSAVGPLVGHILALCRQHPELADVDAIVPMPRSTARPFDPVREVADALGKRLR